MNAEHDATEATLDRPQPPGTPNARASRPEPARTAPLRQASTLLRESVASTAQSANKNPRSSSRNHTRKNPRAQAADGAPATGEDPVALGVRLGYQVIEEQILHGQKLAQRLGRQAVNVVAGAAGRGKATGTPSGGAADTRAGAAAARDRGDAGEASEGDVNELIGRVVDLYKDLGSLCVDAVETLARHPVLRASVARMAPGAAQTVPPAGVPSGVPAGVTVAQAAAAGCVLDIRSSRRTQVTLDLRASASAAPPRVHALHAVDPGTPPLAGVCFVLEAAAAPVLQVHIADTQPAGLYTGVVVDSLSNEPRGTLTVRLLP